MEGRKRWVIVAADVKWKPDGPGYWNGKFEWPMWEQQIEKAKVYKTRDQADSDLLFLVAKQPDLFGWLTVESYMDYGPRLGEV